METLKREPEFTEEDFRESFKVSCYYYLIILLVPVAVTIITIIVRGAVFGLGSNPTRSAFQCQIIPTSVLCQRIQSPDITCHSLGMQHINMKVGLMLAKVIHPDLLTVIWRECEYTQNSFIPSDHSIRHESFHPQCPLVHTA